MARIFLAGHRGMVGSAIQRRLLTEGHELITKSRQELDLTDHASVRDVLQSTRPDVTIVAAAKVGGIGANSSLPAEFIHQNLMIECNLIHESFKAGVTRLLFLGSSCIYPKEAPQPMPESALLTGPLEPTNEPYAVAKIAGIKLCESYNRQYGTDYRSVMPTNLYGPNDYFHPEHSHVLPALLMRFHEAAQRKDAEVVVWGSGSPRREFLHVDDMADASLFVLGLDPTIYKSATKPMLSHINVGCGDDVSIRELAEAIADVTGYRGRISFDASKPDGTPRKLLDVSLLSGLGWSASIPLRDGLRQTYDWFRSNVGQLRQ
jgi:nucleoside-diphosphate-sugar epimerase